MLALAPAALASPAGSEYLPKAPQSGAHSGSASGGTSTSTLPESTVGSSGESQKAKQDNKKGKARANDTVAPVSSGSSGGGGDSGSIFTSPVFLLIVAGVIVVVAGVVLRRRRTAKPAGKTTAAPLRRPGPAAGPTGAGPDKTTK